MNDRSHPRPLFREELPAFARQQQFARAFLDEHAEAPPAFDEVLVHQFLVPLKDREWIHSIIGRYRPHRRQWITLLENSLKDHGHHAVAKLTVNRLALIPLTIHQSLLAVHLSPRVPAAVRSVRAWVYRRAS